MIRISDLQEAIAECQGEKNPNAQTCIKLAAYYTILNQLTELQPEPALLTYSADQAETPTISINSGSEFAEIVNGQNAEKLMPLFDELVQTVAAIAPSLYNEFIRQIKQAVK